MARPKKRRLVQLQSRTGSSKARNTRAISTQKASITKAPKPGSNPKPRKKQNIPFSPTDRILLVGEGDFSFAASLATHHGCTSVLATTLDPEPEIHAKYPQAATHMATVSGAGDASDGGAEGLPMTLCGVDATKLERCKAVRRFGGSGGWDKIAFNFPHVGGKTKDVNRQVRYNQGQIIVTLFEGEPYTLWNIRDLARHVGLRVVTSFQFHAEDYPGYKHARTIGNIVGKSGAEGGAWRGEERVARTYIFMVAEEAESWQEHGLGIGGKRKRKKTDSSSDQDEEDDEDEVSVTNSEKEDDNDHGKTDDK